MENQPQEFNLLKPEEFKKPLEYATVGKRFMNHLIDLASFYGIAFSAGVIAVIVTGDEAVLNDLENINPVLDRVLSTIAYGMYIGLIEGISGGKTLGKLITKTRAVNDDGSRINFSTGFLRGISQIVPFESFSAFGGYPWHDKWTDTRVVTEECLRDNE